MEAKPEGREESGCGFEVEFEEDGKMVERTPVGESARRRRARRVDV